MPVVETSDIMAAYFDWLRMQQEDEETGVPITCKATNEIYDEPINWRHGV